MSNAGNVPDTSTDRAGSAYWNAQETNKVLRPAFDPGPRTIRNFGRRTLDAFLTRHLEALPNSSRLLELGCGGSTMLPYFHKNFGFDVAGLDYSEQGCELAEQICLQNDCKAQIVCADLFSVPPEMRQAFDVVVSFGLAEHFADTAGCMRAFSSYLRNGGLMITTVPNMAGVVGRLQKFADRRVFETHVVLDAPDLCAAHRGAGLTALEFGYLSFLNFGVVNPGSASFAKRLLLTASRGITGVCWAVESMVGNLRANKITSPYAYCVARKS
jgi:2-polyprenyl-3-methyl-5-hydroxy-6-metoxy-1,4-benzoquinol methylase